MNSRNLQQTRETLSDLLDGYRLSAVLICAVRTGILDALANKPQTVTDLAQTNELSSQPLRRLLRALEALSLCRCTQDDEFELTETGRLFCRESDNTLYDKAELIAEQYWPAWQHMEHSLRTGTPAFNRVLGTSVWEYRVQNPAAGNHFQRWMNNATADHAPALAPALSAALVACNAKCVADIGGGSGVLLMHLLQMQNTLTGVLLDNDIAVANVDMTESLRARFHTIKADFFNVIPVQADAYILKSVLHDWSDADATIILRNLNAAMPNNARAFIVERTLDQPSLPTILLDLHMLAVTGGRERKLDEFNYLLRINEFQLRSVNQVNGFTIIEVSRA